MNFAAVFFSEERLYEGAGELYRESPFAISLFRVVFVRHQMDCTQHQHTSLRQTNPTDS